jgi:hypothetical protein
MIAQLESIIIGLENKINELKKEINELKEKIDSLQPKPISNCTTEPIWGKQGEWVLYKLHNDLTV